MASLDESLVEAVPVPSSARQGAGVPHGGQAVAGPLSRQTQALNCLLEVSNLIERSGDAYESVCRGTVEIIRRFWDNPESTSVRITVLQEVFETDSFQASPWKLGADIRAYDRTIGLIEVHYPDEKSESAEGPILPEERKVLHSIAERLGRIWERLQAEAELREYRDRMRLVEHLASHGTGWPMPGGSACAAVAPRALNTRKRGGLDAIGKCPDQGVPPCAAESALQQEVKAGGGRPAGPSLTDAETTVLRLISEGMTNKQIARLLSRSIRTIERHRYQLMHKLNVKTPLELAKVALALGLTSTDLH